MPAFANLHGARGIRGFALLGARSATRLSSGWSWLLEAMSSARVRRLCVREAFVGESLPSPEVERQGNNASRIARFALLEDGGSLETEPSDVCMERFGLLHVADVAGAGDDDEFGARDGAAELLGHADGRPLVVLAPQEQGGDLDPGQ